jgi:hypothetical protein
MNKKIFSQKPAFIYFVCILFSFVTAFCFLLPSSVYSASSFTDATATYGIADGTTSHLSSCWIDIDNDDDLDLYSVNFGANNKIYINNGPAQTFTDTTAIYGIADGTTSHRSCSWIDIDNDGDMDLYSVNQGANNKIYINNGSGQAFTDATTTYGIGDGTTTHLSSSWVDLDNDGDMDLYSINNSSNNKLYTNNGLGQAFTDATATYGVADGTIWHRSSSWIDIDNDGDMDLYLIDPLNNNKLFINNGPNQIFTNATSTYGIADSTTNKQSSSWIYQQWT